MNLKKTVFLLLTLSVLLSCVVPDNNYLMELNRQGKWKQAASIGKDMLERRDKFTFSETAETYFHVAYALVRMKDISSARAYIKDFDNWRTKGQLDPELSWVDREVFLLKEETGQLDPIQNTLLEAMNANQSRDYEKAIDKALSVLDMSGVTEKQTAYAYFLASICSYRLGESNEALRYLDSYNLFRESLYPDDLLLLEEQNLYQALGREIPGEKS